MSGEEIPTPPRAGEEVDADEGRTADSMPLPGGDFRLFATRLSLQAMLSLGIMENPLTGQKTLQLDHARMMIDDLAMLQEKTEGNLEPEERAHLDHLVENLKAHLVQVTADEAGGEQG